MCCVLIPRDWKLHVFVPNHKLESCEFQQNHGLQVHGVHEAVRGSVSEIMALNGFERLKVLFLGSG